MFLMSFHLYMFADIHDSCDVTAMAKHRQGKHPDPYLDSYPINIWNYEKAMESCINECSDGGCEEGKKVHEQSYIAAWCSLLHPLGCLCMAVILVQSHT